MDLKTRKKNRLLNFDYSRNGAYFITICTKNRFEYLSAIENQNLNSSPILKLSDYGVIAENELKNFSLFYNNKIFVDKYVIMPNHIHFIISIENDIHNKQITISQVVKQFKGAVTKKIGFSIWQKSFHDHIIRNEKEYAVLWNYIEYNPCTWEKDCLYVKANSTTKFLHNL